MRDKLRSQKGFTLVELLATLVIVVLLTASVALGANAGFQAMSSQQFASQSEILASTIETVLSTPVRTMDDTTMTFTSKGQDYRVTNPRITQDGNMRLVLMGDSVTPGDSTTRLPLVNEGLYGVCRASVTSGTLTPDGNGVVSVTIRLTDANDASHQKDYTFQFKVLDGVSKA